MVAVVGLASMLIALSFAEVASRFDGTGGPYLYTRAAFGRFAAFEVGWMHVVHAGASWAAVVNVLVSSLGFYWPGATGRRRARCSSRSIIAFIAAVNVRGIRQSSLVVNLLTLGKLLPLAIFIVAGLLFVDWTRLTAAARCPLPDLSSSALLLIYAFGGYEVIPVVAGETQESAPRRTVRADHDDCSSSRRHDAGADRRIGTLPALAASQTPLADAAALFHGGRRAPR